MRNLILILAAAMLMAACKTSETAYRAAYEKAVAGRTDESAIDSTIYGNVRRQMTARTATLPGGGSIEIRTQHIRATAGAGATADSIRAYSLVAGGFKQLFNARSLRQRLIDAGYPNTFIAETSEPYYYVITGSYTDLKQATDAAEAFDSNGRKTVKTPAPFILEKARRR